MTPTHKKRAYNAACIQWLTAIDKMVIIEQLRGANIECSPYGDQLMIRYNDGRIFNTIDTMNLGDWLIRKANNSMKVYTDEMFKIKYEEVE